MWYIIYDYSRGEKSISGVVLYLSDQINPRLKMATSHGKVNSIFETHDQSKRVLPVSVTSV